MTNTEYRIPEVSGLAMRNVGSANGQRSGEPTLSGVGETLRWLSDARI